MPSLRFKNGDSQDRITEAPLSPEVGSIPLHNNGPSSPILTLGEISPSLFAAICEEATTMKHSENNLDHVDSTNSSPTYSSLSISSCSGSPILPMASPPLIQENRQQRNLTASTSPRKKKRKTSSPIKKALNNSLERLLVSQEEKSLLLTSRSSEASMLSFGSPLINDRNAPYRQEMIRMENVSFNVYSNTRVIALSILNGKLCVFTCMNWKRWFGNQKYCGSGVDEKW